MIYVHVPFCRSFCTYCGFYSEICSRKASQQVQNRIFSAYVDALLDEIKLRLGAVPHAAKEGNAESGDLSEAKSASADRPGRDFCEAKVGKAKRPQGLEGDIVPSLYIGGGTPSVLPVEMLERIVQALGPAEYEEFTIEVNPDDIVGKGTEYVSRLLAMGVNRISMGVQSFDDGILRWMNRRHDAAEAREAFRILREGGVRNISIDLIFGLSQLSDDQWRNSIAEALSLGPEHISAYQLSIEEGSALAELVRKGEYAEASDEQCRRQYDILCESLAKAGYRHYEVSNWALPGKEAVHNSAYWRRVSYVGLGPGAHSFDAGSGVRSWNSEELASYDSDDRLIRWTSEQERLSETEAAEEKIMLALRTAEGLPYGELSQLVTLLGHESALVDGLLAEGSLVQEGSCVRIPEDRFFVSDGIIARLI